MKISRCYRENFVILTAQYVHDLFVGVKFLINPGTYSILSSPPIFSCTEPSRFFRFLSRFHTFSPFFLIFFAYFLTFCHTLPFSAFLTFPRDFFRTFTFSRGIRIFALFFSSAASYRYASLCRSFIHFLFTTPPKIFSVFFVFFLFLFSPCLLVPWGWVCHA